MKYYAKEEQISTKSLDGGIEITQEQYREALDAKVQGKLVYTKDELVIYDEASCKVYNQEDGSEKQVKAYEDVPDGYTKEPRPDDTYKWDSKQNKWVEDTEAKELNRISLINQKANEVIESKYPLYKQLNVRAKLIKDEDGSHYTDTDIETMDMFIDAVRSIAKQAKANGTPVDEVDFSNES